MTGEARSVLDGIPADLVTRPELAEVLAKSANVRVERIVSRGHASPRDFWYDQAEAEWVLLFSGRARLRFENDRMLELGPGDHVLIQPHERHRVDWTDPAQDTIWIAVFYQLTE
jgi:cupin 2 domain-containing protein